jgi:hypothetical protein
MRARAIFFVVIYAVALILALATNSLFAWVFAVLWTPIVISVVWAALNQKRGAKARIRRMQRSAQRDRELRDEVAAEDAAKQAKKEARRNPQQQTPPPPPPPNQKP